MSKKTASGSSENVAQLFAKPSDVDGLDCAFGGDMQKLLPPYDSIPDEFKQWNGHKWVDIVDKWFYSGLPKETEIKPKSGVDPRKAMKHLQAIMVSFRPKHEHKTAGVAYLMSLWFDDIVMPAEPIAPEGEK
jgi:hypothetical protein